jgi:hypothetical protein
MIMSAMQILLKLHATAQHRVHWTAGTCRVYRHFSGFEFFLLLNIVHARQ